MKRDDFNLIWQLYVKMLDPVLYVLPKRTIRLEDFCLRGLLANNM